MNKIEETYKQYAVQISNGKLLGSGCLFQPATQSYCYVLTAKHCIVDDEFPTFNIEEVVIKRGEPYNDKLSVKEIYLHEELDIAVITIDCPKDTLKNNFDLPIKGSSVYLYGFPNKLKDKIEPRENIDCKISFRHNNYFEIASENLQFTFNTTVPENLKGLSGSGVFFEREGQIYLVGIFTKLKGDDGAYNKFSAFDLDIINSFIIMLGLTSLSANNFESISKNSELLKKVFYLPYSVLSEPYYFPRSIDKAFKAYFTSTKNLWFSGHSGVGKTNCVIRNLLVNNKKFIFIDLSTLQNKHIDDYFEYINSEIVDQYSISKKSTKENIAERVTENLGYINSEEDQVIIFIDEVPIQEESKFNLFVTSFITISDRFVNSGCQKSIKWIVSTRINPKHHINNDDSCLSNLNKATKLFHFKHIDLWDEMELEGLLQILQDAVNFSLDNATKKKVIETTKGYPGKLKDIIERVILENIEILQAIEIVKSENYHE